MRADLLGDSGVVLGLYDAPRDGDGGDGGKLQSATNALRQSFDLTVATGKNRALPPLDGRLSLTSAKRMR